VLGFFPRVDAKASAILAINTATLVVLASNAAPVVFDACRVGLSKKITDERRFGSFSDFTKVD
jgi:hypothetical protein